MLVDHLAVAESAVVSKPHDIKGECEFFTMLPFVGSNVVCKRASFHQIRLFREYTVLLKTE